MIYGGHRDECQMSPRPTALLIDDGELDDVDRLLGELTDRHRLCGGERPDPWPWPRRLLVVTPERVLAVPPPPRVHDRGCRE